jgi:hypothetical protein
MVCLPVDIDLALAESRGYRVGWVLAHQHCDQLPPKVDSAVGANARNKIFFSVEPSDARKLVRFVAPWFTEHDLSSRAAYEATVRTVADGHDGHLSPTGCSGPTWGAFDSEFRPHPPDRRPGAESGADLARPPSRPLSSRPRVEPQLPDQVGPALAAEDTPPRSADATPCQDPSEQVV